MSQKLLSTTALAKELGLQAKDLFQTLMEAEYIKREDESWVLTAKGKDIGGTFRINPILSELGLVQKSLKGWTVTKLGESIGGKQI